MQLQDRIQKGLDEGRWSINDARAVGEALAAERRATVERLRRQLVRSLEAHVSPDRILLEFDEEAR